MQSSSNNNTKTTVNITTPRANSAAAGGSGYRYTVKVINPEKKSTFNVHKLSNISEKFNSIADVKKCLTELLGTQVDDVGYISPGHGLKGRQNICYDD